MLDYGNSTQLKMNLLKHNFFIWTLMTRAFMLSLQYCEHIHIYHIYYIAIVNYGREFKL